MCRCQPNWESVLKDLFSEFPVVADAAVRGAASFSHPSAVPMVAGVVLTQCSCVRLLW
jgi:hypothetical protein